MKVVLLKKNVSKLAFMLQFVIEDVVGCQEELERVTVIKKLLMLLSKMNWLHMQYPTILKSLSKKYEPSR